jgi:uncharacterized membrane protein
VGFTGRGDGSIGLRESTMRRCVIALAAALTMGLSAATASASAINVFTGTDNGVAFGSALPNANAASAAFNTAVAAMGQLTTKIDFETTPLGSIVAPISL